MLVGYFLSNRCGWPRIVNFPSIGSVIHLRMRPLSPSLLQKLVHPTFFTWFNKKTSHKHWQPPPKKKKTPLHVSKQCEIIKTTQGASFSTIPGAVAINFQKFVAGTSPTQLPLRSLPSMGAPAKISPPVHMIPPRSQASKSW